jgi:hypothetical protein
MPAVVDTFHRVVEVEAECLAANIDENDHTVFTCPDLQFELELLEQAIAKKVLFLENQVCFSLHLSDGEVADRSYLDRVPEYDESHAGAARAIREHVPVL